MPAVITAFSAPGDYDSLSEYVNGMGSNLAILLYSDCVNGYTFWNVGKNNTAGDIVFFYCASKSMIRIAHARVEAKASGNAQMITFANKEYELYKQYAGKIVAIGIIVEKPYLDEDGKYSAVVSDLKRLAKPIEYNTFKDFITLNPGGGITGINEEQETKLLDLMDGDYETEPLVSSSEVPDPTLLEGRRVETYGTKYERNPKVRAAYLAQSSNPYRCAACGFDFEKAYGELGKYYIEVHHIKPLSSIGEESAIDPAKDLVSLCSNCHRMIHRKGIITVEELKKNIITASQG